MLLFKDLLLYSVKSQQHIIIYHVLIRILHFLRKRRLKKWNQEGKEIQSILFSISSFNNRIIVQLEQLYDSIHFKTTFRTQKNSIMKNNSSSSLISHLEHNGIFNTCQLCRVQIQHSLNVGRMGNKGIFALQRVQDCLYIYVSMLLKSVLKAYKTKLQTAPPAMACLLLSELSLGVPAIMRGLLLLPGHRETVQPQRAAHPTLRPRRLNPFWSNLT